MLPLWLSLNGTRTKGEEMISKWIQVVGLGALIAIAIAAITVATASVFPRRLGARHRQAGTK
jgi:hypothetical protein